ncbi:MAG: hypothetical protein J0H99_06850 [Rhodospirillales bacterium]|nr:hypothetical protein [Rhodospirillales bacterium]
MPGLVSDEMLELYATVGLVDDIAAKLRARYAAVVTDAEVSIPIASAADLETLSAVIRALQAA